MSVLSIRINVTEDENGHLKMDEEYNGQNFASILTAMIILVNCIIMVMLHLKNSDIHVLSIRNKKVT